MSFTKRILSKFVTSIAVIFFAPGLLFLVFGLMGNILAKKGIQGMSTTLAEEQMLFGLMCIVLGFVGIFFMYLITWWFHQSGRQDN